MKPVSAKRWTFLSLLVVLLLTPSWVIAKGKFGRIVVFGDSLSDPGNAFALTGMESTPPYDALDSFLIPDAPYARGGHHFSNGATWVEQFARPLGLAGNVRPAFQGSSAKASNYAVGGARARDNGSNNHLSIQVFTFLSDFKNAVPSDALYVVEIGGDDVRDALLSDDPDTIIEAALKAIDDNIRSLYASGARKFLIWNVPNLALAPSVKILDSLESGATSAAELLANSFNAGLQKGLDELTGLPGIEIILFDFYGFVDEGVKHPQDFGLTNVEEACIMPNDPPFACHKPDGYLFWDGIHPTKAGHAILAQEVAKVLAQ